LQSYEKTREIQKESSLFFLFPSETNFGEAKVTKKREKYKKKAMGFAIFSFIFNTFATHFEGRQEFGSRNDTSIHY